MIFSAILSLAACLQIGSVRSFQVAPPPIVVSTKRCGTVKSAAAKARSSTPSLSFTLFFAEDSQAELEEIELNFTEITTSLDQAKKRQEVAQENIDLIREERERVVSETEMTIARLKNDLSEEISDLSDQIEGTQDELRRTTSKAKSGISNIRGEDQERKERLCTEISDLESRLAAVRQDAANATKDRDTVKDSIKKDQLGTYAESRKEIEEVKRAALQEKKKLTTESRNLENRIQQAEVGVVSSVDELEEAKRRDDSLPNISTLKDALIEMKERMLLQVEELKENLAANAMRFEQSLKNAKDDERLKLDAAKSAFEGNISGEDSKYGNVTSYYDLQLEAKEKELLRNAESAGKPVESAGVGAISEAKEKRIALNQDKIESVSIQNDAKISAMENAVDTHSAIQDRYDAEYENERWNLKDQDARTKGLVQQEDRKRERRNNELQQDMQKLARELPILMQEERATAERDYQHLKQVKTTELANLSSRSKGVTDETQKMRSDLMQAQYELKNLEKTSQENQDALSELEKERTSFRKQVRRTMKVAIDRITSKSSRVKGK